MFRQSELRRQLEATERELANQKWVFERFLESPAWRMTYPIRWIARQARRLFPSPSGRGKREGHRIEQILKPSPAAPDLRLSRRPLPEGEGTPIKELLTAAYRASLH